MSEKQKTATKVLFLVVLWTCFVFKAAEAYSFIQRDKQFEQITTHYVDELIKEQPNTKPIVTSNVVMVWNKSDTELGWYSFNNDEFIKLQQFARLVGPEEFELVMSEGQQTSKSYLMSMVDNRLGTITIMAQVN